MIADTSLVNLGWLCFVVIAGQAEHLSDLVGLVCADIVGQIPDSIPAILHGDTVVEVGGKLHDGVDLVFGHGVLLGWWLMPLLWQESTW